MADRAELQAPSQVRIGGWLGQRIAINAHQRLSTMDTAPLLAGFQAKPGSHPWIGEHVGKWLHAATLAWAHDGDPKLRAKLDRVAAELVAAQEPDGYLGTYEPGRRFALHDGAEWDVWSHKYGLIGLIAYHRYTGNETALTACRRAADLLLATFPAQRSILAAGTHLGMAATSVLEPIVELYRVTGDARYLAFARYLVAAWDEPGGPAIVLTLLAERRVNKVANGKAYEMLSNLVGLCELARVTGERPLLDAALIAWQDIVDKRLFPTGSTSHHEVFQDDNDRRATMRLSAGETCVTTTWIQLNLVLLQLTGEARFGHELERSYYNHLTAAQHPAGEDWCYYTALEGRKIYDAHITCCHSSGPRALALAPQLAYLRGHVGDDEALLVNTLETSSTRLVLGGVAVEVEQRSGFPHRGGSHLRMRMAGPARFAIRVRVPDWAMPMKLRGARVREGWAELPARIWRDGDTVPMRFELSHQVVAGTHFDAGRTRLGFGPFVLACERDANLSLKPPHRLRLPARTPLTAVATGAAGAAAGPLLFDAQVVDGSDGRVRTARFVPFADAGAGRGPFAVWLRTADPALALDEASLLTDGREIRSRPGNIEGSIIDEDPSTLVCTYDGRAAEEDWFGVELARPVRASRFVFVHGDTFPNGGWFDTSAGRPRLEIRRNEASAWTSIGEFTDYPQTNATNAAGLGRAGVQARFTLTLPVAVDLVAVRVIGRPASGTEPGQAFASCAELQALA